jgi:hypothetical protein
MTQPAYQFSHHEADGLAVYTDGVEVLHPIPAAPVRKFRVLAQHMLSATRAVRIIEASSEIEAATAAIRELADTDYYLLSAREVV